MTKELLENIDSLRKEVSDIEKRIINLSRTPDKVVRDSVRGSSDTFPYTQHSCVIEGVDTNKYRNLKKLRRIYKSKHQKLDKLIIQLEYELNRIEDVDIRRIIRYKYEDGLNWIEIMFKMEYNSEAQARIKLKRFFEKNLKCTFCTPKTC